jgi:hypothetical protein
VFTNQDLFDGGYEVTKGLCACHLPLSPREVLPLPL